MTRQHSRKNKSVMREKMRVTRIPHKQLDDADDIHVYQEQVWTPKHEGRGPGIQSTWIMWLAVNRDYVMDNPDEDFIGVTLTKEQAQRLRKWLNQLGE